MNIGHINGTGGTLRIREYYYLFLRHKFIFSTILLISLGVSVLLTYTLPKIYRSESILLTESDGILNPLINGLAISPSASSRMKTFKEELLSWERLTLLIEKLGMNKNTKSSLDYERLIKKLRDHLMVSLKGSGLIAIQYEGTNPRRTQEVVQTLTDIIVQGNLTSTKLQANSAIQFIEQQLEAYRQKLENSETALREFQEIYNSTLPLATEMNEQLVQLKLQLERDMIENTEHHPRVLQTKKLIEQIERQRNDQMKRAKEAGFDLSPKEYADLVSSIPRQKQHLDKLQRDYGVNSKIYTTFLQRLETAKISQMLEQSDKGLKFRVLEQARLPLEPVKPNKLMIILAGLFIGVGLGALVIYFLEMGNTSIRNLDEARDLLELPIFGAISIINPEELEESEKFQEELRVVG